jgi:hypothetical protein
MSKIGKDECKEKKLKKNSFPFIQGDRMDGCKEKKKMNAFPFILSIWKCVFVVPKGKHPTSIHNT